MCYIVTSLLLCAECAGENSLPGKYDIVKVDLQPSEQYKSVSPSYVIHTRSKRQSIECLHASMVKSICVA